MGKKEHQKQILKAEELAERQREISVAQFFTRNRHLLGFDNPARALLMTVKELVDNGVDACDEMRILGDILVEIKKMSETRYTVIVEDNGPGIVKKQIPSVFGKLLYGSKFFSRKQGRGQQGLGVSMSVLYSQLTTGKATKVISKIGENKPAHYYELKINADKNEPEILKEQEVEWKKSHGTRVEIELEARYQKGKQSVDEYIKQTVIANPHISITYITPEKEKMTFPRATNDLPVAPKEIKPHPYGIELGTLMSFLSATESRTLQSFLTTEFSRVSSSIAKEICTKANVKPETKPHQLSHEECERLFNTMQQTKLMAPPTDCLSPIGEESLVKALRKEFNAEFFTTITRSPVVYRGFPFCIEAAVVYDSKWPADQQVRLIRLANRVPLLYQQGACAITEAVTDTNWKSYGLQQSQNSLPAGPVIIVVHMVSVWVPFTSEAKDAVAHYPDIIKEIKLALQDCGRKLLSHIRKTVHVAQAKERMNLFERYIPEVADALAELSREKKESIANSLQKMLKKSLPILMEQAGMNKDGKAKE